ncbi:hypothetical protein CAPTEDRAFT_221265 [Capitella teleta]|uniref:Ig-like domain-containing protein n=1 Tax=Capitella teleta TaxID=283909 RepID=R7V016_CAPTE|nr:hypothetical protein CAPTEDRAFT_221265 [Capitella teleta]|eukprot:ELU11894.1 hypothetical protein CAPTEDRAFT_221265 [Capitella teleta]
MAAHALCAERESFFIIFFIISVLLHSASASTQLCPAQCACLGNTVSCSKKDLDHLPDTFPEWTDTLDVSSNKLTELSPNSLNGLSRLTELNLNNNGISEISRGSLDGMPNLNTLHHNEITALNASLLELMPFLHILDLNFNQISLLQATSFPFLPNLHQLFLNSNRLQRIEANSLDNLPALEWLKLKKNRLEVIPKDLFAKTNHLKYLELSRNRIRILEGLGFSGLRNLLSLKMRRNSISQLLDGAFYGLDKIQILQLDYNNISSVSKGWLYGLTSLQQLSLSHNQVTHVEEGGWDSCSHLWQLDLTHNNIVSIMMASFKGLESLQYLLLNHNKVSSIAEGALKELPSLQVLELSHNEISWAIEDSSGVFDGLVSLTRLSLDSNQIKSLSKQTFVGLAQLRLLRLVENPITSIQSNAFEPLKDLNELRFNSTSLLCDCQLSWLGEWLRVTGFDENIRAECSHPEELKGRRVVDVASSEFKCNAYPKPVLQQDPEGQIALKGSNATLVCEGISSDPSAIIVHWKKDGDLLPEWRIENIASVSGFITQVRSILHLLDVQDEDTGVYQCIVSNTLGSAYSSKASVTVHVYPVFEKRPTDVTVRVGNSARLECAASGQPAPEIAWQKDGGHDFPAARERRMHVMPKDHVFFIMEVKSEDQGVYSCTASNAAGTAVANASVNVLETPSFVSPMVDKVSVLGDTSVLECLASGSPKPHLTWFKDREELVVTERHFLTADDQLLIIVQTTADDAGLYTCVMSNTLGTEKGVTELSVVTSRGQQPRSASSKDDSTTTGIIIIAVVCCVVGTSLIWVIIIYHTRKRSEEYSSTPTDDTALPAEVAAPAVYTTDNDMASYVNSFGRYSAMDSSLAFSNRIRGAAIFPSDVTDDNRRQQIPLTRDEQQIAEASDNSLITNTDSSSNSHSSLQSAGHLQTFHPIHNVSSSFSPSKEVTSSLCRCDSSFHQNDSCVCVSNCRLHSLAGQITYVSPITISTDLVVIMGYIALSSLTKTSNCISSPTEDPFVPDPQDQDLSPRKKTYLFNIVASCMDRKKSLLYEYTLSHMQQWSHFRFRRKMRAAKWKGNTCIRLLFFKYLSEDHPCYLLSGSFGTIFGNNKSADVFLKDE